MNDYKIIGEDVIIYCILRDEDNKIFEVYIDLDDLEKVLNINYAICCHWVENGNAYYATITKYLGVENGKPQYKSIMLHQLIMDCPKDKMIDHINNDTLDNRKRNLRIVTKSQNLKNRKSKNSNNKSGYRNVSFINNSYRVQLQINGKNHLFSEKFDDPKE